MTRFLSLDTPVVGTFACKSRDDAHQNACFTATIMIWQEEGIIHEWVWKRGRCEWRKCEFVVF